MNTEIKFGIVLVSYVYNKERAAWAESSFRSLSRTNVELLGYKPDFQFTYRMPAYIDFSYFGYLPQWAERFEGNATPEPDHVKGLDPIVIWSANKLLSEKKEVTHVMFLMDDYLYHPDWLMHLRGLIERHPDARAWTVYRSAYTRHHKTLKHEEWTDDHYVTSISGIGCLSRKEWEEYGPDWHRGHGGFPVPESAGGGNTLDLHHAHTRPGERWATGVSYIQHIGARGLHCNVNEEQAVDFAGEVLGG